MKAQLAVARKEVAADKKIHGGGGGGKSSTAVERLLHKFQAEDAENPDGTSRSAPTKGAMKAMDAHMKSVEGAVSHQIHGIQHDIAALKSEQAGWGDEDAKEESDLERMVAITKKMKNSKMAELAGRLRDNMAHEHQLSHHDHDLTSQLAKVEQALTGGSKRAPSPPKPASDNYGLVHHSSVMDDTEVAKASQDLMGPVVHHDHMVAYVVGTIIFVATLVGSGSVYYCKGMDSFTYSSSARPSYSTRARVPNGHDEVGFSMAQSISEAAPECLDKGLDKGLDLHSKESTGEEEYALDLDMDGLKGEPHAYDPYSLPEGNRYASKGGL